MRRKCCFCVQNARATSKSSPLDFSLLLERCGSALWNSLGFAGTGQPSRFNATTNAKIPSRRCFSLLLLRRGRESLCIGHVVALKCTWRPKSLGRARSSADVSPKSDGDAPEAAPGESSSSAPSGPNL